MKFKNVNYFQAGGPMPAGSPAQLGGEDPSAVLLLGAQLAVLSLDCLIAMQVCLMIIQALGGGMSLEPAPQESAPAPAEGEPVYRRGGRLLRRISL